VLLEKNRVVEFGKLLLACCLFNALLFDDKKYGETKLDSRRTRWC
jgi:hypothetical protein